MKNLVISFAALLLMSAVAVVQVMAPKTVVCEPPDVHLKEIPGFTAKMLAMSEAEKTVLPSDTHIEKKVYVAENGDWFTVSLVIGGKTKSSLHRPELCLPSQGFLMQNPHTIDVEGTSWRVITLASKGGTIGFAYTFFNQTGYRTSSHTARIFRDIWDRSMLGRIDRWAMVTVNSSRPTDDALRAFLPKVKGMLE